MNILDVLARSRDGITNPPIIRLQPPLPTAPRQHHLRSYYLINSPGQISVKMATHETHYKYTGAIDMQHRTRKERRFDETEHDLPDFSPFTAALSYTDKAANVLSYLGKKNPFARSITEKDTVWLLDNTAYRNEKTGKWEAEFISAAFSQDSSCTVIDAVSSIAGKIDLDESDPNYPTIEERIRPFVQDIKPGAQVNALQGGNAPIKLGPGGRNGISSDVKRISGSTDGTLVPTFAKVPEGANGILEMKTFYAEPEGWGVISGKF